MGVTYLRVLRRNPRPSTAEHHAPSCPLGPGGLLIAAWLRTWDAQNHAGWSGPSGGVSVAEVSWWRGRRGAVVLSVVAIPELSLWL